MQAPPYLLSKPSETFRVGATEITVSRMSPCVQPQLNLFCHGFTQSFVIWNCVPAPAWASALPPSRALF